MILQCARALARAASSRGVTARAFRSAADRQSDLIAQIAGPLVRPARPVPDRADDLAREVARACYNLHVAGIKSAVRDI